MTKRKLPSVNLDALMGDRPRVFGMAGHTMGSPPESLLNQITAGVEDNNRVMSALGDSVREYRRSTEQSVGELSARLQHIEQVVAGGSTISMGRTGTGQSVGAMFVQGIDDNTAFAHLRDGNQGTCRLNTVAGIKAALINEPEEGGESGNTYIPSQAERRGFILPGQRLARLLDVLPSRPTESDAVEYIQLNATGDAAEQEREGDETAEIDADGVLRRAEIVTISANTTASKQVLADHGSLLAKINQLFTYKLLAKLEDRLINGVGGQGKIDGLLNLAALFAPTIGTTPAEVIGEALVRQADAGYLPNLIILNPMDWFRIQITKNNVEGEYIFGSPTMPVPPALWGTQIIATPSMPEGKGMSVDTAFVTVLDREKAGVLLSNSHKDYFTRNLVAILGELRAGLEVTDAAALWELDIEFPT